MTVKGLGSMATRHLLAHLGGLETCPVPVEFESGGGVAVADRVAAGEPADVVVLGRSAITRLTGEGHLLADSVVDLFDSSAVLAVPSADDQQAPTDTESLERCLLGAGRIGWSTGPSGTAFLALLDELGIHDAVRDRLVQARPGHPVGAMVASGEVDLGIQQLSEMTGIDGVRVLGPLPAPHAITSTFSAAVAASSRQPEVARQVVDFLASPVAHDAAPRFGMQPAATSHRPETSPTTSPRIEEKP